MCVLLSDVVFKHSEKLFRKTDLLKTCRKSKYLGKKIWRNALAWKSKKLQGIFGKTFIWHYYLQLSFVYKTVSQISFKLFCSGDKIIRVKNYQSSIGNEVDFRDILNVSPDILAKNWNFKKLRQWFCRWKSTDNNDINIFLSLENPCTFLLAKNRPENAF